MRARCVKGMTLGNCNYVAIDTSEGGDYGRLDVWWDGSTPYIKVEIFDIYVRVDLSQFEGRILEWGFKNHVDGVANEETPS
jgi:hypothetical protein